MIVSFAGTVHDWNTTVLPTGSSLTSTSLGQQECYSVTSGLLKIALNTDVGNAIYPSAAAP